MEFLLTYGWAIVVVLVAISALAYFGVLTPGKWMPRQCIGPQGLSCIDHEMYVEPDPWGTGPDTNKVRIILKNNLGDRIYFTANKITIDDSYDCSSGCNSLLFRMDNTPIPPSPNNLIANGEKFRIEIDTIVKSSTGENIPSGDIYELKYDVHIAKNNVGLSNIYSGGFIRGKVS